jgi:hypothetical protein
MKVWASNRLLVVAFCAAMLVGIVFLANRVFNNAQRWAVMSTLASITAGIQKIDYAAWEALRPTGEWRELPPEAVDALLERFHRNGWLDISPGRVTTTGEVVDPWGGRYHVLIRTVDGGRDALVWAVGGMVDLERQTTSCSAMRLRSPPRSASERRFRALAPDSRPSEVRASAGQEPIKAIKIGQVGS